MAYTSVFGEAQSERVVEKSRFIAYAAHTGGEESAREFLARIRSLHPLATHVCWAYVADKIGNELRFSDDGEPQGTAGMPILGVIRAQKLFETSVAVVRYFGGIKLGAGGLTRAYSACAAEGLAAAERRVYDLCAEAEITADYAQIDGVLRFLSARSMSPLSQEYGEKAKFTVAVKKSGYSEFCAELADYFNGRTEICEKREYFYPFPLDNPA